MRSMSVSGQLTFSVCARILNNGISSNSQSRLIMSLTSLWVSVRNYVLERKLTIHTSQSQHHFITPQTWVQVHLKVFKYFTSTLVATLSTSTSTIAENDNVLKLITNQLYNVSIIVQCTCIIASDEHQFLKSFISLNGSVDWGRKGHAQALEQCLCMNSHASVNT